MPGAQTKTEKLSWISHPAKEEPRRNWIVVFFLLLTVAALWIATRSGYWVALGVIFLLVAIRQWFIPTTYRLDEIGAEIRFLFYRRQKNWADIKRLSSDRKGVLLSPFPFPSRLESFRGLYLRFSGNRAEVLDFLARHVEKGEG